MSDPRLPLSPALSAESLATELKQVSASIRREFAQQPIASTGVRTITFALPACDLLTWLQHSATFPKSYWHDRAHTVEFGAVGNVTAWPADAISNLKQVAQVDAALKTETDPALPAVVVAGRFDEAAHHRGSDWRPFPDVWIQLPRFSVQRVGAKFIGTLVFLRDTAASEAIAEAERLLQELIAPASPQRPPVPLIQRRDRPDRVEWNEACGYIIEEIRNQNLSKAVLARRTELIFADAANPFDFLRWLGESSQQVYRFLLSPRAGSAFVGASPERLFKVQGRKLSSEAVAGTVPRGQAPETDDQLARLLLESRKDNREHRFVVDGIAADLRPICREITIAPEPEIVKLRRVQHLVSEIHAELLPETTAAGILTALHPTAAVCGTPRAESLLALRQLEPFDRGYYAGPVGILQPDNAEFAVALRSALVCDNRVILFAGAGIVAGSDPDLEWLELEQKLQAALELLVGMKA